MALKKAGAGKVIREVAQCEKNDRAKLRRSLDQLDADDVVMVTPDCPAHANSSSSALASFRSLVPRPSVNQP
jgi:hypothetical protein